MVGKSRDAASFKQSKIKLKTKVKILLKKNFLKITAHDIYLIPLTTIFQEEPKNRLLTCHPWTWRQWAHWWWWSDEHSENREPPSDSYEGSDRDRCRRQRSKKGCNLRAERSSRGSFGQILKVSTGPGSWQRPRQPSAGLLRHCGRRLAGGERRGLKRPEEFHMGPQHDQPLASCFFCSLSLSLFLGTRREEQNDWGRDVFFTVGFKRKDGWVEDFI